MADRTLGSRRIVRLARRWVTADLRGVALVRRADTVPGLPDVPRLVTIPPRMLLVLRERELLLLAASRGWRLGAPGTVLSRWPVGRVRVAVQARCAPYLAVRIATEASALTVASSWWQRKALESIGRLAG